MHLNQRPPVLRTNHRPKHPWHYHGATMLEILVTLVIVALGLLGIAGMKLVGLKDSNLAYQITIAAIQAQDMAERIGANRVGMSNYNNLTWWTTVPTRASCEGTSTTCTSAQIATDDFYLWNDTNRKTMPSGNGRVLASGNDFLIGVRWSDPQLEQKDANGTSSYTAGWDSTAASDVYTVCGDPADATNRRLRCYVLRYRP